jgi:hypothetical protein
MYLRRWRKMKLDLSSLIPMSLAQCDFPRVARLALEKGPVVIVENDVPKYVLMDFKMFSGGAETKLSQPCKGGSEDSDYVMDLLNRMGKAVFVDYYYVFKKDDSPEEKLPHTFTLNSRRSRTSVARRIFRENLAIKALELIVSSSRLEDDVVRKARQILQEEQGLDVDSE